MKSLAKEFTQIFKDRSFLIAIAAVMVVPIMYAGMFLWAFWDPYDQLEDVPVAIVNEDESYEFEGETLTIGDELVDNLKEEDAFDFHFVDKKTGLKGLENQDYYILIEIPEDFSEKSTTMMDDVPEKINLIYKPNESYNFLASQIGETAMLQIEKAIEEKITETYAKTIFENIEDVAEGLVDASEATEELNDGAIELKDGSEELEQNLFTLADKTIEFSDGVNTAATGVRDLREGTASLTSGINELYDNSNKLRDASIDLETGANALTNGITQADDGLREVNKNVPKLIDGTNEVQEGLTQLHNQLPKEMADKVSDTVTANKDPVREKIDVILQEKLDEYKPEIKSTLTDKIASGAADSVVIEANNMIDIAPENASNAITDELINRVKEFESAKKNDIKTDIKNILSDVDVEKETIEEVTHKLDELEPNYEELEVNIQTQLEEAFERALSDVQITPEQQQELEAIIKEKAAPQVKEGVDKALDKVTNGVDDTLDEYEDVLLSNLDDITETLETEIHDALNNPIGQLKAGVGEINEGQQALGSGVNQLVSGTSELKSGANQLTSGQHDYVANMNKFANSMGTANSGANELLNGTHTLYSGMFELQDGSIQLSDGAHQLAEGSETLSDGMLTLAEGTDEFNDEMHDAAKEANDIETNDDTYNMIADPVKVKNEKINNVPNYGTGFAPYFLSLGLFVGALLLSIVFPLREPAGIPTSGLNWFLSKFGVLLAVGIIQALIASTFLLIGLGLEVQNIPLFILFAVITSLTFITLIQFFVTCLGDPGRFIAIIILIIQLTTSAGTFPLELIPKALQPLNMFFPMTYSVSGFKAVISSGDYTAMWQNVGVLIAFTIVFMLLTLFYFIVMYKRKFDTRQEEVEVESNM